MSQNSKNAWSGKECAKMGSESRLKRTDRKRFGRKMSNSRSFRKRWLEKDQTEPPSVS